MSKSIQFPGALFFSPEYVGKRVFNGEDISKLEEINDCVEIAKSRIEHAEQNYMSNYRARQKEAWNQGYQAGLKKASVQMLEVIQTCQKQEKIMTQITLSAIKKVLDELPTSVLLPCLVSNAITNLSRDYTHITVCVSPGFVDRVEKHLNKNLKDLPVLNQIDVVEDLALAETDCQIKTRLGVVNASLSTQLAAIESVFIKD